MQRRAKRTFWNGGDQIAPAHLIPLLYNRDGGPAHMLRKRQHNALRRNFPISVGRGRIICRKAHAGDQPFDRQIVIPAVAFSGARHERENNDIYSSCRLIVRKNGAEIYNRTALDNTLIYSGVIDMPAGRGHMTLEFSVSAWLVNNWYPTASISDLLVVVMKKATTGITIS